MKREDLPKLDLSLPRKRKQYPFYDCEEDATFHFCIRCGGEGIQAKDDDYAVCGKCNSMWWVG